MSAAKHTQGPWQLDVEAESAEGCRDVLGCGFAIASTHGLEDDEEDLANACLIVAAPELLEALREATELVELLAANCADRVDVTNDPRIQNAHAAIAKATGSTS